MLNIYNVKKPTKDNAFQIAIDLLNEINNGNIPEQYRESLTQLAAHFRPDPLKKLKGWEYVVHTAKKNLDKSDYRTVTNHVHVLNNEIYVTNGHYAIEYKLPDDVKLSDGKYNFDMEHVDDDVHGVRQIQNVLHFQIDGKETADFKPIDMKDKNTIHICNDVNGEPVYINKKYYKAIADVMENPKAVLPENPTSPVYIFDDNGNKAVIMPIKY